MLLADTLKPLYSHALMRVIRTASSNSRTELCSCPMVKTKLSVGVGVMLSYPGPGRARTTAGSSRERDETEINRATLSAGVPRTGLRIRCIKHVLLEDDGQNQYIKTYKKAHLEKVYQNTSEQANF